MTNSNYQHIGNLLYQRWKNVPNEHPYKDKYLQFVRIFSKSALFLAGFGDEKFDEYETGDCPLQNCMLPLRSMVLEMPFREYHELENFSQPILYLSQVDKNSIYVEVWHETDNGLPVLKVIPVCMFVMRLDRDHDEISLVSNKTTNFSCNLSCREKEDKYPGVVKSHPFMSCPKCKNPIGLCADLIRLEEYYSRIVVLALNYINNPSLYILKESQDLTPKEARLAAKDVKPNFFKKPRHIVLDYSQVKELSPRKQSGADYEPRVMPHERRGHWRQLKHERYRDKKMVWVRPTDINAGMKWVGINQKTYEVFR